MFGRLIKFLVLILFLNSTLIAAVGDEGNGSPSKEYMVKGGFLFNFFMFIQFADESFINDSSPFILGIYGGNPFGDYLKPLEGEKLNNRIIRVVHFDSFPDSLEQCHILFLAQQDIQMARTLIAQAQNSKMVLVGETPGFATAGGAINFINEDGSIKFEINTDVISARGHNVSSRLLALAKLVETELNR
jgi:YfiR/HmsC-like